MKQAREKIFREIIQGVGLDKPSGDFTQVIMNEVRADADGKAVESAALKSLVREATTEAPSSSFTYHAMKKVRLQGGRPVDQSLISWTAWLVAAAITIGSILILLVVVEPSGGESVSMPGFDRVFGSLHRFIGEIPYAYVLTVVSAGAVLAIDYLFMQQRRGDSNPRIP